jgi:general secretion pathway protein C
MGRYVSWAINAVLFVFCCYLLANAANEVFAALLTPSLEVATAASDAPAAQRRSFRDRQAILDRNLFNASLLAPPKAPEPEPEPEDLAETTLPLRLLGTAAAQPAEFSWAAVEDETERRTVVVRIDDELRNATVERIERRRIVLREGGALRELTLDEEESGPQMGRIQNRALQARSNLAARRNRLASARRGRTPARTPTPTPTPQTESDSESETVRQVGENEYEVDRDDAQDLMRNPTNLFSQARILPKYADGEMVGLQVNGIKSGSLFEEIGLESGDVITRLNGITINDPTESAKVLSEFSEADNFTVDVERSDGSIDTIEFMIGDEE